MVDWEEFYGSFREPGFVPGYEIQHHLGGGAFGEVYKARKTSIDKAYAIKFLRLDAGASSAAVERELDQVRLFASIDHPNLVTIEDMGVARGVPYLIMGYAGEDTLARRIARRELDRESALRTFVQTCRGVLALHDRRLAHFDLKPGNVFLNGDVARVGDYGLAKLLSEGRQTLSFGRGTPHYMAPEMLKSRADHRADIYSLGVILFESLTYRLPFGADQEAGLVREDDRPAQFPADFEPDLRRVVERCLRLDPEDRFASVDELLGAMGQTGRQGDSILIEPGPNEPATGGAGSSGGRLYPPLSDATEPSERPTGELRQAAAELARGAVGVARGVWSGVTERVTPPSQSAPAGSVGGSGSREGLADEPTVGEPTRPAAARAAANPWREAADVLAVSGLEEEPQAPPVAAASPRGRGVTIPVPPRVEGGLLATLSASFALGTEMMGMLLGGPVLALVRAGGRLADRSLRRVPGFLGAGVRLGLFVLGMALLGALVSFVLFTFSSVDLG